MEPNAGNGEDKQAQGTTEQAAPQKSVKDAAFWQGVHAEGMQFIAIFRKQAETQFTLGINHFLTHFTRVIEIQSRELTLHRELETYIRDQTLTEESCSLILNNLAALRAEVQAATEKMEAATEKMEAAMAAAAKQKHAVTAVVTAP